MNSRTHCKRFWDVWSRFRPWPKWKSDNMILWKKREKLLFLVCSIIKRVILVAEMKSKALQNCRKCVSAKIVKSNDDVDNIRHLYWHQSAGRNVKFALRAIFAKFHWKMGTKSFFYGSVVFFWTLKADFGQKECSKRLLTSDFICSVDVKESFRSI